MPRKALLALAIFVSAKKQRQAAHHIFRVRQQRQQRQQRQKLRSIGAQLGSLSG